MNETSRESKRAELEKPVTPKSLPVWPNRLAVASYLIAAVVMAAEEILLKHWEGLLIIVWGLIALYISQEWRSKAICFQKLAREILEVYRLSVLDKVKMMEDLDDTLRGTGRAANRATGQSKPVQSS